MRFWTRTLPLAITLAYRLIPPQVRATWSLGSSSSHRVLADPSWATFRAAARLSPSPQGPKNQWGEPH
jgi:hypothetical protein